MSYNYANGDGYSALNPAEPADSDQVAVLGAAVRQIKKFLNDPQSTFGGKYAFNAIVGGAQLFTANGVANKVLFPNELYDLVGNFDTATSLFTAPVDGVYHFQAYMMFGQNTADTPKVRVQTHLGKNGLSILQIGDIVDIYNTNYGTWSNRFSNDVLLVAGDTMQLCATISDMTGTGNIVLSSGRFEGYLITRV